LGAITRLVNTHAALNDVYLGCGLSLSDRGPQHRCKSGDVIAIPALWADLDIAGPCHKNAALPPDVPSALAVAEAMPLPPSLYVFSGHGIYPWWLLTKPWLFADDAERDQCARLVRSWQEALNRLGRERGWRMDNTADLARVLRVPGTVNRKAEPVPVTADLPAGVRRYERAELLEALAALPERKAGRAGARPRAPQPAPASADQGRALDALRRLSPERATGYDTWLAVGMALHAVSDGEEMLAAWDEWSKQCEEKYEPGACAAKWGTFHADGGLGLGSLIHWAQEGRPARKQKKGHTLARFTYTVAAGEGVAK
jgi:putative DNA primase/helicase